MNTLRLVLGCWFAVLAMTCGAWITLVEIREHRRKLAYRQRIRAIALDSAWSDTTLHTLLDTIDVFHIDEQRILHLSIVDIEPWLAVAPRWTGTP